MAMYDKTSLMENLRKCVATVTFTKADNTIRVMLCTLMADKLPPIAEEHKKTRKENEHVLSVWDLEKNAWRSFKLNSVIDVQYIGVDRV